MKAVYIRGGEIFGRIDPGDNTVRFNALEDVDAVRSQVVEARSLASGDDSTSV